MKKVIKIILIFALILFSFWNVFSLWIWWRYPNPVSLTFKWLTIYINIMKNDIEDYKQKIKYNPQEKISYEYEINEIKKDLKRFEDVRFAIIKFRLLVGTILFLLVFWIWYFFYKNR